MEYVMVINQQMRNPNRPSLTKICDKCDSGKLYQHCHGTTAGSGILVKENEAFCLPTTGGSGQYVLVTPKSTSTQLKSTKGTSVEAHGIKVGENNPDRNGNILPHNSYTLKASTARHIILEDIPTMETQQKSNPKTSPTLTFLSGDSLARLSALLESEEDLKTPEALSSLTSLGFSPKKDPDIFYSKTSKVYLVTTREKLSRQSLGFSPTWGIELNGRYLTAKTSEFPKTESASSLSDILETNVEEKYFLSQETADKLFLKLQEG